MFLEKSYHYYLVKFDDEKTYWYRSQSSAYRVGAKVIVPISNNGKWKIGTIAGKQRFTAKTVPYPLESTKGIVQEAGLFADGKVKTHNNLIETSKYPPVDISVSAIKTRHGVLNYTTCARERELAKEAIKRRNKSLVVIENYPVADFKDIPYEAQKRLKDEEDRKIDEWLFEMEELDLYN